jgi:hypothetical protein
MRILITILFICLFTCTNAQLYFPAIVAASGSGSGGGELDLTNVNIVVDGDSYNNGESNRLVLLEPFASNGADFVEYAVGGQQLSQMLADQATEVLPALVPGVVNILIFNGQGNSLYYDAAGDNATAVEDAMDEMKEYVQNARDYADANGIDLYIISTTLIPRDNTELGSTNNTLFNQKIQLFNTVFMADNSWVDGYIRPDLEAMFATFADVGYDPDHVHPSTPTGYDKMAELKKDAILNLTAH